MRSFLILLFSGLSLLTRAQSRDSVVLPSFNDTSTINYLIPVTAHNNNNKADSIQNRTDYEYIFNYKKKKINMGDNKWNRTMGVMGKKIALNQQKSLSLLDISSLVQNVHSKK